MAFTIPEELRFTCLGCKSSFKIPAFALSGREEVYCPLCAEKMGWLEALEESVRREILAQVKEELDRAVDRLQSDPLTRGDDITAEVLKLILQDDIGAHNDD